MDKEINVFLKKEFAYRIKEWVELNKEIDKQYSNELLNKIQHIEEVITTAVKYRFLNKDNTNQKVYNYMESLLEV